MPLPRPSSPTPQADPTAGLDEFAASWDAMYGDRGFPWSANPWVWVIEFRRIDPKTGEVFRG